MLIGTQYCPTIGAVNLCSFSRPKGEVQNSDRDSLKTDAGFSERFSEPTIFLSRNFRRSESGFRWSESGFRRFGSGFRRFESEYFFVSSSSSFRPELWWRCCCWPRCCCCWCWSRCRCRYCRCCYCCCCGCCCLSWKPGEMLKWNNLCNTLKSHSTVKILLYAFSFFIHFWKLILIPSASLYFAILLAI